MADPIKLRYIVDGADFTQAGEASGAVKRVLKQLNFPSSIIRRVGIAMYEGEINMVIHADGGVAEAEIDSEKIIIRLIDEGPGIANVELAMQEGFSTAPDNIRSLGFGAGMGLPNMKKYSDEMHIDTKIMHGTAITIIIYINPEKH